MNDVKIIEASGIFWEQYKALRLEALLKEPQAFGASYDDERKFSNTKWKDRVDECKKRRGDWMVFASEENNLVGMLGAFQTDDDKSKNAAHIIGMYVQGKYRGQGISKLLMQGILSQLQNDGILYVTLAVNKGQIPAVNLYKQFGFSITSEEHVLMGDGNYHDEYIMSKDLV